MYVTVKLFAGFRQYLPSDAGTQGIEIETEDKTTPRQLLDQLQVPKNEVHLVLLNGVFVEPAQRDQPIIRNNDVLAVWPAVAGG